MTALAELVALCPPPPQPVDADGEVPAALATPAAAELVALARAYGSGRWLGWLIVLSPFAEGIADELAGAHAVTRELAPDVAGVTIGYADGEDLRLVLDDGGHVTVVGSDGTVTPTGLTLTALLRGFVRGEVPALPAPAELTGDASIAPYFQPDPDPARSRRPVVIVVAPGDAPRPARVAALTAALGAHQPWRRAAAGGDATDVLWFPVLELELHVVTSAQRPGVDHLNVWYPVDREAEVGAALMAAVATAGLTWQKAVDLRGRPVAY